MSRIGLDIEGIRNASAMTRGWKASTKNCDAIGRRLFVAVQQRASPARRAAAASVAIASGDKAIAVVLDHRLRLKRAIQIYGAWGLK
jgi:hypothetical protein